MLTIASFIIHYLGWQAARGLGSLADMATNRSCGLLPALFESGGDQGRMLPPDLCRLSLDGFDGLNFLSLIVC